MNRDRYQLVFNETLGKYVPQPETARRRGKAPGSVTLAGAVLAGVLAAGPNAAFAVLPVASTGGSNPAFVTYGQGAYQTSGNQATVSQVGNRAIFNWQSFNISNGSSVTFQQVDSLANKNLVQGASFTALNRIWDANPSLIAGAINQAPGQQANIILVNNNGIAFMNGAQVNLNSFTATSLNIADKYITGNFLGDNTNPQFQQDPSATPGFVTVLEGAQITAGTQGRVMLIAPTVSNRGVITAPDGQIILAAGTKAYLRSAGTDGNLRGLLVEVDSTSGLNNYTTTNTSVPGSVTLDGVTQQTAAAQNMLGQASNSGTLSTPRGNITMVGFAVNQSGMAQATTSVVSNGSIYLMAKDSSVDVNSGGSRDSSRGGQVILGAGSKTEVLIEADDKTTSTDNNTLGGTGLDRLSEVRVLGQSIYMDGTASITANAGNVSFTATANPAEYNAGRDALQGLANVAEANTRVHIASGATIDVSGLSNVSVDADRNIVAVQLRGDELKDSPANRTGPVRGQTVYVDVERALANANAGKDTLIAKDSLQGYANQLQRTAAERATKAGTVNIQSDGQAIVESGVKVNLSGGSISYKGGYVPYSILSANGVLTDASDALAGVRYTDIPTNLTVKYDRWNRTETFGTNVKRYQAGYVEGQSAGTLSLQSIGTAVMQASITGQVTVGAQQLASATMPTGATLQIGSDLAAAGSKDYKINQAVRIGNGVNTVVSGLGLEASLDTVESPAAQQTLELDAALVGEGKVANLQVYSNKDVSTSAALRTPQKGSVQLTGANVTVGADITAASGTIAASAVANYFVVNQGQLANTGMGVRVNDGVTLSTAGVWRNDKATVPSSSTLLPIVDGGTITLSASSPEKNAILSLGTGVQLDASGGAHMLANGTVVAGKGGAISVAADAVQGLAITAKAYGIKQGGSLSVSSTRIKIGGALENAFGTVNLDPLFFSQGGFSSYALNGYSTLELAANTVLQPRQQNYQLTTAAANAATGTSMGSITSLVTLPDPVRGVTNLTLKAQQNAQNTGTLTLAAGSDIEMDKGATVNLTARSAMTVAGTVRAQGGTINLTLDQSGGSSQVAQSDNLLHLTSSAVLDASGVAKTAPDATGGLQGSVLNGGTVVLNANTGYVVADAGSVVNVDGAAPVTLNVRNEAGTLGRSVASDAGTITVFGEEGIILQSTLKAKAGAASQRGGNIEVSLSHNQVPDATTGYDTEARELHVGATQPAGTTAAALQGATTRANLGWNSLQASGADTVKLTSRDAIVLDSGLNAASGNALPLRELTLDAARIQTSGGNVTLAADTVTMGNASSTRVGANAQASTSTGTLSVQARKADLLGNLHLSGMALTDVKATELISLDGVTRADANGKYSNSATINSTADLSLTSPMLTTSSYASVVVNAAGKTVTTRANGTPAYQPYSALGSLTVNAQNIDHGGNILMPFGSVDLEATAGVVLQAGSQISVADQTGAVLPLGQMINGKSWVVNLDPSKSDSQVAVTQLPQKSVVIKGSTVDMQSGSTVNLSGGGDLQAYEFTVGPGGSKDVLANANTYAILPGYQGGFSPTDPQEAFALRSGTAVYLSGVPGLAAGVYTLLPAHYALLPGAYAVRLNTGISVAPGQTFTQQDGTTISAGYLTDTRANAPKDANWQGIQVLSNAQVHDRSELTTTNASSFFASASNRPADAGSFSVTTTGAGAASLNLNGSFVSTAGAGGNGMSIDISAPNLALVSGSTAGIDTTLNTVLNVSTLNAMGASSILLGGTRSSATDSSTGTTTTTLNIGANTLTLANDANHALQAPEVILAATDTVTLKSGSAVASGNSSAAKAASNYTTAGMGALVRVADSDATFVRTGNPGASQGTLVGEAGSSVVAAKSVILDATQTNAYQGSTAFRNNGQAVAGSLQIGAPRVNFGSPTGAVTGITYSQAQLDAMSQLASIGFTSYSSFDFYGDVAIGGLNAAGSPTLGSLALHGAGIAGLGSSANTIALNAKSVLLDNPGAAAYAPGGTLGSDQLQITANTLTFGAGDKTLSGLSSIQVNAQQVLGQGTGKTTASAPVAMAVQRVSGAKGSNQSFTTSGAMTLSTPATSATLDAVTDLGGAWSMAASDLNVDTQFVMPSGAVNLTANAGNLVLGNHAGIDVAGRTVSFFDQSQAAAAGSTKLTSATGNVVVSSGATVNVSAAAGGDAGQLSLSAVNGAVQVASGTLQGSNLADSSRTRGQGAQVSVDTGSLADFSGLNSTLNSGGFSDTRNVRLRNGNLAVAASDTVTAQNVSLSADNGQLDVRGSVVAKGDTGGNVGLYASGDVTVYSGASVNASATGAGKSGGKVEIGSTAGNVALASGSAVDVSAGSQGTGGSLNLRAARNGNDVKVSALDATVTGARTVTVEAVKTYTGIATLNATGTSSGSVLSLSTINTDNTAFAANNAAIAARLQMTGVSNFGVVSGVEVRSAANGNLTLANDWNMVNSRAGGMPGNLTLRSAGNLALNGSLSDGFSTATALTSGGAPATVSGSDSWGYRLVAGADFTAANAMAVGSTAKNFSLANDKLVRTGTGDIKVAASGNITLGNAGSVIYTAGSLNTDPLNGFVAPPTKQVAYFTQNGGDVSLAAGGDITGAASKQLYSEWLYREGELASSGSGYATNASAGNPAWWVRFDQFKQGVATLGGGKVSVKAGGSIRNVSASAVTQGRVGVTSGTPVLARTGGGNVLVQSGADILGGQYFADGGKLTVRSGGKIDSGQVDSSSNKPVYTVLAASDGQVQISAVGDLNLQTVVNPTLLPQTKGGAAGGTQFANIPTSGADDAVRRNAFSSYGTDVEVDVASLAGNVTYMGARGSSSVADMSNAYALLRANAIVDGNYAASFRPASTVDTGYSNLVTYAPASLSVTAFQGNLNMGKDASASNVVNLAPSSSGQLDLLAKGSVTLNMGVVMNGSDPALLASVLNPSTTSAGVLLQTKQLAATPLHSQDATTAHVYAETGNVQGVPSIGGTGTRLELPKAVSVQAGQDIVDLTAAITNNTGASLSSFQAGRDIIYTPASGGRNDPDGIKVAGSGDLDVVAGRNISLGTSGGIVSIGNLENANLPAQGSDIHMAAGVGAKGIDYTGAVNRLLAALQADSSDATLWQARWLTGDNSLTAANAAAAVQATLALKGAALENKVRNWMYTAMRTTGRDYNVEGGAYAGDASRGYAALNLLFPGIETRNADGTFANYKGELNMFASRIKSSSGGNIDFLVPGGDTVVGLANTPAALISVGDDVLGIVVSGRGNIEGFVRNNVTVNQSRILAVGGGDLLLWSSEGDIDAGKGKKTASAVPPPIISVDSQGNVTQTLQGAATGSGIGALAKDAAVDLIAPKGVVNAGDAGIRAGFFNGVAHEFKNADNVAVTGRAVGVPVADTSAVTAAASGATSLGDDASKSIAGASQAAAEASRTAQQLASAFKPSVVSVDVIGYGE